MEETHLPELPGEGWGYLGTFLSVVRGHSPKECDFLPTKEAGDWEAWRN